MNSDDEKTLQYIEREIANIKRKQAGFEEMEMVDSHYFWKSIGAIAALVKIKKFIREKYLNAYQKSKTAHIVRNFEDKNKKKKNISIQQNSLFDSILEDILDGV